MKKSKFGKLVALGALVGGALSLFDRGTREVMKERADQAMYYAKNPTVLKETVEREVEKWTTLYDKVSSEITYYTNQFGDLKELTPEVKQMVVDTKEAFVPSKDK